MKHGTAASYKGGCRCDSCRAAATVAMRRYRAGERSPWGSGRAPNATSRAIRSAMAAYSALTRTDDGYSDFDVILHQEEVAVLGRALAELTMKPNRRARARGEA